MRRRLFNFAAVVSLVLCVCAAVWVVTRRPEVRYSRTWGVRLMWQEQELPAPPYRPSLINYPPPEHSFAGLFVGATWRLEDPPTGDFYVEYRYVVIPQRFLFPFALLLAVCSIRIFYLRRRHLQCQRDLRGECLVCGYSLTGNTSGVCPECGTPVADKAGVKA